MKPLTSRERYHRSQQIQAGIERRRFELEDEALYKQSWYYINIVEPELKRNTNKSISEAI